VGFHPLNKPDNPSLRLLQRVVEVFTDSEVTTRFCFFRCPLQLAKLLTPVVWFLWRYTQQSTLGAQAGAAAVGTLDDDKEDQTVQGNIVLNAVA